MSDLSDLRRIYALYAQRLDDRNVDGLTALFTPEAKVEAAGQVYKGQPAIRDWLNTAFNLEPDGVMEQHQAVNPVMTVNGDGETAVARTDILCFRSYETAPWELELVERHHDRFVKAAGQWYFSEKAIEGRGGFKRTSNTVPNIVSID